MAVRSAGPVLARKAVTSMKLEMPKALAALAPAIIASPAFARGTSDPACKKREIPSWGAQLILAPSLAFCPTYLCLSPMTDLPSMTVANEVQFPAYLAVFLGVGFPVAFLIATYIQVS